MNKIKRLSSLTLYNIKVQFRQGFYYAWLFITIFYIAGLYFLPPDIKNTILPLIILSESSTFAMIFTCAIILLERDEKMLENLFITPLPIKTYIFAKMLSITLPAVICILLISIFSGHVSFNLLLLIPAVMLTTFFFVIFSLSFSVSAKNILSAIGRIGIYGTLFTLSILDFFGIFTGYHQYLLPSKGALVLISTALSFKTYSIFEIILSFATMIAAFIFVLLIAEKSFYRQIILKGGE